MNLSPADLGERPVSFADEATGGDVEFAPTSRPIWTFAGIFGGLFTGALLGAVIDHKVQNGSSAGFVAGTVLGPLLGGLLGREADAGNRAAQVSVVVLMAGVPATGIELALSLRN